MSRALPYLADSLDHQGRVPQTRMQAWEDAAGTCNTCPGELEPAEALQRDAGPPPYPWRALGAGLAVVFAVVLCVHLAVPLFAPVVQVAAK